MIIDFAHELVDFMADHKLCDFQVIVTVATDSEALDMRLRSYEELDGKASHLTFLSAESGREL